MNAYKFPSSVHLTDPDTHPYTDFHKRAATIGMTHGPPLLQNLPLMSTFSNMKLHHPSQKVRI
jgi:hypothetical protein